MSTHSPRIDMISLAPKVVALMREFSKPIEEAGIEPALRELIKVRASQINGCAFCLDMHVREARKHGITDDKLHLLAAWRDAPQFTDAERAALALTEAVTRITDGGVSDEIYERVRKHFSAEQYIGLLTTINVINGWNRFMIATGAVPPLR